MRRLSMGVGAITLGWILACSGITDQVKGAIADEAAKAIAQNLGVDESEVSVKPLDSGRWALDTPDWDANCGFGPQAKKPAGFQLKTGGEMMADCKVEGQCTEVLGLKCGKDGDLDIGVVLQLYPNGTTRKQLENKRTKEMEGKGWTVSRKQDDNNKNAVVLTAMKGKQAKAVAVVSESDGGNAAEILVSQIK